MSKIIMAIALIGSLASGKDTAEGYIEHQIRNFGGGYEPLILRTSELLDEEVKNKFPDAPVTQKLKQLVESEIDDANPNFIVDKLYKQIVACPKDNVAVVINSVQTEAQAHRWLELIDEITFIYLRTNDDIRFERYNLREKKAGRPSISSEDFDSLNNRFFDASVNNLLRFVPITNIFDNSFEKAKLIADINGVMSDIL